MRNTRVEKEEDIRQFISLLNLITDLVSLTLCGRLFYNNAPLLQKLRFKKIQYGAEKELLPFAVQMVTHIMQLVLQCTQCYIVYIVICNNAYLKPFICIGQSTLLFLLEGP